MNSTRPTRRGFSSLLVLAAAALLVLPAAASAQFGGPGGARFTNAFEVGGRAGYDFRGDAPVLGAYARSGIIRRVAVQLTGDLTFLDRLTERQAAADLLFQATPGFWIGAGAAMRNTVFGRTVEDSVGRETKVGYTVVGILGGAGGGRFSTGIEIRFTSVEDFDAQLLALQVGIPLARW